MYPWIKKIKTMTSCYPGKQSAGLIIIAVFIISRIVFFFNGVGFISRSIDFAFQYLDPVLLKNDLLHSLFYLNSQPPLFNMFLGIVLKASNNPGLSFKILYLTAGMLIPLLLYGSLSCVGINRMVCIGISIFFMLNPTFILYENLLYYSYMEALFILLAIFMLAKWGKKSSHIYIIMFWTSILCLCMIRSLFHPVFPVLIVTVSLPLLLKNRIPARMFCAASLIAILPLTALCIKNTCVYGFFGTSSWMGISLWTKANGYSYEKLQELHDRGIISSIALQAELRALQPIDNYEKAGLVMPGCHHPADCNKWRSTGKPNFNQVGYIAVSRQLFQDALALIKYDPKLFSIYTAGSYSLTHWYSSDSVHVLFEKNMAATERLERIYRFLYAGFMGVDSRYSERIWIRTLFISAIILFFYAATLRNCFKQNSAMSSACKVVCLFCMLIHAYTILVSSFIEFGENNRFRFPVDPAFAILVAVNIDIWLRQLKKRKNRMSCTGA